MTNEIVTIYTDGACSGNPGPGGWGAVLTRGDKRKPLFGSESYTTNNKMELTAALKALQGLTRRWTVQLYSDSNYLVRGMKEWLPNWKARGWRKADGKPVENAELWKALDEEAAKHDVQWIWVKGHSGNPGNERADALANYALRKQV